MHWILAFHIIALVAWFAGLFYLPRLFVYHADAKDTISNQRFKVMEHKLYYYISLPAAVLTTMLGLWLLSLTPGLLDYNWFRWKLIFVGLLWVFQLYCGRVLLQFAQDKNTHSSVFFRFFNEIPTVLLIGIVIMAIVHP